MRTSPTRRLQRGIPKNLMAALLHELMEDVTKKTSDVAASGKDDAESEQAIQHIGATAASILKDKGEGVWVG